MRCAVREALAWLDADSLVLVACSGGADSVALAAAAAFEAPRLGFRVGGVTVDHRLQAGSGDRAAAVAALLTELGLDPVEAQPRRRRRPGRRTRSGRPNRALCGARRGRGAARARQRPARAHPRRPGRDRAAGLGAWLGDPVACGHGGRRRPALPAAAARRHPPSRAPRAPTWARRCGTTRTTPTRRSPGFGCASECCRYSRRRSGRGRGGTSPHRRARPRRRRRPRRLGGGAATPSWRTPTGSLDVGAPRGACQGLFAAGCCGSRRFAAGVTAGALAAVHLQAAEALITDWHGQGPVSLPGGRAAAGGMGGSTSEPTHCI